MRCLKDHRRQLKWMLVAKYPRVLQRPVFKSMPEHFLCLTPSTLSHLFCLLTVLHYLKKNKEKTEEHKTKIHDDRIVSICKEKQLYSI